MIKYFKRRWCPGRTGRLLFVPSCLLLVLGYAYTAALLLYPGRGLPKGSHFASFEPAIGVSAALMAMWHAAGYLGYVRSDHLRKTGFLFSASLAAGFSALLLSGGYYLSGGYVGIGALVAAHSYWRYPRRNECGST